MRTIHGRLSRQIVQSSGFDLRQVEDRATFRVGKGRRFGTAGIRFALLGRERERTLSEEGVSMAAGINKTVLTGCGCALIAFASATASADTTIIPDLMMRIGVAGQTYQYNAAQTGNAWSNGDSTFGFAGAVTSPFDGPGYNLSWGLLVNPDPFIVGNIVVTNTSNATQTFFLEVTLPINVALATSVIGGSVTGTVTDLNGDGATVAAALSPTGAPGAIYQAFTDVAPDFSTGNLAGSLLVGASASAGSFLSQTIGPDSFGSPIPSLPYGAVSQNIAIRLAFTLTAGDSASFTSLFVVVPAPGAMAVAALGLIAGRGRRRSA